MAINWLRFSFLLVLLNAPMVHAQVQPTSVLRITSPGFVVERDPVFTDIDGDGELDVVVPTKVVPPSGPARYGLRAYTLEGSQSRLLWKDEPWDVGPTGDLIAADLTGDGNLELGLGGGTSNGAGGLDFDLRVYDSAGTLLPGYPFDHGSFPSGKVEGVLSLYPKFARMRVPAFGAPSGFSLILNAQMWVAGKSLLSHLFFRLGVDPSNRVALRPGPPAGGAPPFLFGECAVGDIYGNGLADIVFHARPFPPNSGKPLEHFFYVMSARRSFTYPGWPRSANHAFTYSEPFSIANMDKDARRLEMVTFSSDSSVSPAIVLLKTDGTLIESPAVLAPTGGLGQSARGEAVFLDAGSDGEYGLLVQTPVIPQGPLNERRIDLLQLTGNALVPATGWTPPAYESIDLRWNPMLVGDVDGDAVADVVVASRSDDGARIQIYAFDEAGSPLLGFPADVPFVGNAEYTLALVEGLTTAGRYDIVLTRSAASELDVFKFPTAGVPGPRDWPVYRHDYGRSGNAVAK